MYLLFSATTAAARNATPGEMARLIAAAWEDSPMSVDVTFFIEHQRKPMKLSEVERSVRYAYDASERAAMKLSHEEREFSISQEVERIIREQELPRYARQRVRVQRHLYRLDETKLNAHDSELNATPTATYVNGGTGLKGDYMHFVYDHQQKTATVFSKKGRWQEQRVADWLGIPTHARAVLKILLGAQIETGEWVPSPDKSQSIAQGEDEQFLLDVEQRKDQVAFSITLRSTPGRPSIVLICDAQNYSKVYETCFYNFQTGKMREKIQRDDFDRNGFPRSVHHVMYTEEGIISMEANIAVEKVELGCDLPQALFEFNAAEGYVIVDRRFKTPLVLSPNERELTDSAEVLLSLPTGEAKQSQLPAKVSVHRVVSDTKEQAVHVARGTSPWPADHVFVFLGVGVILCCLILLACRVKSAKGIFRKHR